MRRYPRLQRGIGIVTRIVSASLGGYGLAVATAFAFARGLPASRVEATTAASLIAILAMPIAAIWSFAAPRAWSAVAGVCGLASLLALLAWALGPPT